MTTKSAQPGVYVESFMTGWHRQRSEHFITDHYESTTVCGLQFVPRNVTVAYAFEGACCSACRDGKTTGG